MREIWKDIKNYEGLYQVSNLGRIRSLNYLHTKKIAILKLIVRGNGYHGVSLCKKGIKKSVFVHRVVAETFIPTPNNKFQINHKDGNKFNNTIDNLEWVTPKENMKHSIEKGLSHKARHKVEQYSLNGKLIKVWDSIKEIKKALNISISHISSCANGKRETTQGYRWKYKDIV